MHFGQKRPQFRSRPCKPFFLPAATVVPISCVFRTNVTARFGIVTAEFGNVTGHFGDVTEAGFELEESVV